MPNYMVFSDIHANLEAFRAVLDHARAKHAITPLDAIWCLGDLVGYGPDPGACIDLLRGGHELTKIVPRFCVRGNHDDGVLLVGADKVPSVSLGPKVTEGWKWTYDVLSPDQRKFLADCPLTITPPKLPQPVRLVHAAPPDNIHMALTTPSDVEAYMDAFKESICFFGHTHMACYFECGLEPRIARPRLFTPNTQAPLQLSANKLFLNPGTVGQPRWGRSMPGKAPTDPYIYTGENRATYLWVTLEKKSFTVQCHYVAYPFEKTVEKMKALENHTPALVVHESWINRIITGMR